jgi:hypothetical protein
VQSFLAGCEIFEFDLAIRLYLVHLSFLKGTKFHFKSPTAERRHVLCIGVGGDRTHSARPKGAGCFRLCLFNIYKIIICPSWSCRVVLLHCYCAALISWISNCLISKQNWGTSDDNVCLRLLFRVKQQTKTSKSSILCSEYLLRIFEQVLRVR